MACFIVIHADNKDEKIEIISNFNDKLKYTVVPDLRDYVAKLYKVRFVDEEEVDDGGGGSTQKTAIEPGGVDQATEMMQNDQLIATEVSSENDKPSLFDTFSPTTDVNNMDTVSVDVTQSPANIDKIMHDNGEEEKCMPFGEKTVEPKEENDVLTPVMTQSFDIEVTDILSVNNLFTAKISEKADVEEKPQKLVTPRKRKIEDDGSTGVIECQKCFKHFNPQYRKYSKAERHAITHVHFKRYQCPVEGCEYKAGHLESIKSHMQRKHNDASLPVKKLDLTSEQQVELDRMVKECFPVFDQGAHGIGNHLCDMNEMLTNDINLDTLLSDSTSWSSQLLANIDTIVRNNENHGAHRMVVPKEEIVDTNENSITEDVISDDSQMPIFANPNLMKEMENATLGNGNDSLSSLWKPSATPERNILKHSSDSEGESSVTNQTTGMQCQKCLKHLSAQVKNYRKAKQHAIRHIDLKRVGCPVEGCGYKTGTRNNLRAHLKKTHTDLKCFAVRIETFDLTSEEEKEWEKVTKECFPAFENIAKSKVCTICGAMFPAFGLDRHKQKHHALSHIELMLYKCIQPNCCYKSKYYQSMARHGKTDHGIVMMCKEECEIELTDDQKKEIDDNLKRCFPDDEDIEE